MVSVGRTIFRRPAQTDEKLMGYPISPSPGKLSSVPSELNQVNSIRADQLEVDDSKLRVSMRALDYAAATKDN